MDLWRSAILGGVIPAAVLGVVMLGLALGARPRAGRAQRPWLPTLGWLGGFVAGLAVIQYAHWQWPRAWPTDATYRLLHSGAALAVWGLLDVAIGLAAGAWRGPDEPGRGGDAAPARARAGRRAIQAGRWGGRLVSVALVLWVLGRPFVASGAVGLASLVAVIAGASVLAVLSAHAVGGAASDRHPALPWLTQFLAAGGASVVIVLSGAAVAGQAAAGLAALAAATAVVIFITRRAAPGPAACLAWSGTLAWLLVSGVMATGQTNLASCALLLAAPLGWLLPRRLDADLFWKRARWTTAAAIAWGVACATAAIVVAMLTREPAPPAYEFAGLN